MNAPPEIADWKVYDWTGGNYVENPDWHLRPLDAEDLLCLMHKQKNLYIDLGFYRDVYRILIVSNQDWDEPIEVIEHYDKSELNSAICAAILKYS